MTAPEKNGFTIIELIVVIALVWVLMVFLRPAAIEMRAERDIYKCADNLRQLSIALRLYASEHEEKFPKDLHVLLTEEYINDERMLRCPGSRYQGAASADYFYAGNLDLMSPSDAVLVCDRDGSHKDAGKNILYVSGDIEWEAAKGGVPK